MKKFVSLLTAVFFLTMLLPMTVFGHGHGHGHGNGNRGVGYAYCTTAYCDATYAHRHGNTWYNGHYNGDGHAHHSYGYYGGGGYR